MMKLNFKEFLLNENKSFFGGRVNDILSALHELQEDMGQMGTRHLTKVSQEIVNQIRRILHSSWEEERSNDLKKLQKCGVAIMKAIDEKGDLKETINSVTQTMEGVTKKLGTVANTISPTKSQGKTAEIPQSQEEIPKSSEEEGSPVEQQ